MFGCDNVEAGQVLALECLTFSHGLGPRQDSTASRNQSLFRRWWIKRIAISALDVQGVMGGFRCETRSYAHLLTLIPFVKLRPNPRTYHGHLETGASVISTLDSPEKSLIRELILFYRSS